MKEANLKVGWYTKSILKVIVIALCWVSIIPLSTVREAIADSEKEKTERRELEELKRRLETLEKKLATSDTIQEVAISKILDNPERYNGKKIRVIGKVYQIQFSPTHGAVPKNSTNTFILCEKRIIGAIYTVGPNSNSLQVSMEEHPDIRNRDVVEVTGTFLFRETLTQSLPSIHQYSESSSGLRSERYVHGGTRVIQGGIKRLEADSVKKLK